jgi:hypothetical protein
MHYFLVTASVLEGDERDRLWMQSRDCGIDCGINECLEDGLLQGWVEDVPVGEVKAHLEGGWKMVPFDAESDAKSFALDVGRHVVAVLAEDQVHQAFGGGR